MNAESPVSNVPYVDAQAEQLRNVLGIKDETPPKSEHLEMFSSAIDQMYKSREAFTETSQHALNITLLAFSAGGTLLVLLLSTDRQPTGLVQKLSVSALAMLCFIAPSCMIYLLKESVRSGYDLYVASVLHAAIIGRSLRLPNTHCWLGLVHDAACAKGTFKERMGWRRTDFIPGHEDDSATVAVDCAEKVIAIWRSRKPNLYDFYVTVFNGSAWLGLIITMLIFAHICYCLREFICK